MKRAAQHREMRTWTLPVAAILGLAGWAFLRGTTGQRGHGLEGVSEPGSRSALVRARAKPDASPRLPELLSETGLFVAGSVTEIDPRNLLYVPQYPLWSDGATKRRWLRLPEGEAIDARDPDAFQVPVGTRLWKEFSFGRRVETRYIERLRDGSYRYATYVWSDDGRDARLQPLEESGIARGADGGEHEIPNESDCRACHEGRRSPILGLSALQLSTDRDPNAPHREVEPEGSLDLADLVKRGLIKGLPEQLVREPPRIAAANATERAALGYLYGNCSSCHNAEGPIASVGLDFDQSVRKGATPGALRTTIRRPSHYTIPGSDQSLRVAPGDAERSVVAYRMASRFAAAQMPPLGTRFVDEEALELIRTWINEKDLAEVRK